MPALSQKWTLASDWFRAANLLAAWPGHGWFCPVLSVRFDGLYHSLVLHRTGAIHTLNVETSGEHHGWHIKTRKRSFSFGSTSSGIAELVIFGLHTGVEFISRCFVFSN